MSLLPHLSAAEARAITGFSRGNLAALVPALRDIREAITAEAIRGMSCAQIPIDNLQPFEREAVIGILAEQGFTVTGSLAQW